MTNRTEPKILFTLVAFLFLFFYGCGSVGYDLPIERIKASLKDSPNYSIILEDMKQAGDFIPKYFHKYRIIQGDRSFVSEWLQVPEKYYKTNGAFLGMTLEAKKDGELISSVAPPGYQHVGDPRYGHWANSPRGGTFWEFYGKYAFFSALLGGLHRPIYKTDYDAYLKHKNRKVPYFGRNHEYGTRGYVTKTSRPNFYARYEQRERMRKSAFGQRVSRRIGRTRTGFRSRAGGFGK